MEFFTKGGLSGSVAILEGSVDEERSREVVIKFGKETLSEDLTDCDTILSKFKFIGLTTAFKKFQTREDLLYFEESAIINFANKFTSVSLCPQIMGKKVIDIVKKVNQHRHTKACRKYSNSCRFDFPKFPVWKTIIAKPNRVISDNEKEKYAQILHDVRQTLLDEKTIDLIMKGFDKDGENESEFLINRETRIKMLLSASGYNSERDSQL